MIGRVLFSYLGQELAAELHEGLEWRCAEPAMQRFLALQVPPDYSPADGNPGVLLLEKAARLLRGRLQLTSQTLQPMGRGIDGGPEED